MRYTQYIGNMWPWQCRLRLALTTRLYQLWRLRIAAAWEQGRDVGMARIQAWNRAKRVPFCTIGYSAYEGAISDSRPPGSLVSREVGRYSCIDAGCLRSVFLPHRMLQDGDLRPLWSPPIHHLTPATRPLHFGPTGYSDAPQSHSRHGDPPSTSTPIHPSICLVTFSHQAARPSQDVD